MARQNSKYFSSVIEKLIADKHRENIVPDAMFKERLRGDVLARAAMMGNARFEPRKEEEVREKMLAREEGRMKEEGGVANDGGPAAEGGLAGFLNRWKYALALVPSALLVMLVVAQVMNMPVEMESEVMVPTGGDGVMAEQSSEQSSTQSSTQTSTQTSKELRTFEVNPDGDDSRTADGQADGDDSRTAEISSDGVKKIKTFPGALVMPVKTELPDESLLEDTELDETELPQIDLDSVVNTIADTSGAGGVNSTGGGAVTDSGLSSTAGGAIIDSGLSLTVGGAVTDSGLSGADIQSNGAGGTDYVWRDAEYSLPDTPYYSFYNLQTPDRTADPDEDLDKEPVDKDEVEQTETEDVNDESLELVSKGESLTTADATGDGVGGGGNAASMGGTEDVAAPITVKPSLAVPAVLQVPAGEVAAPVYNITYETALSSTEKAALESMVISSLADGGEVARVVVGRDANGYVIVTVYYKDGGSFVKTYQFNPASGVWDTVTYVIPTTSLTELKYRSLRVSY